MRRLPLWVPDEAGGWMLVFSNGETLHFREEVQADEDGLVVPWLSRLGDRPLQDP